MVARGGVALRTTLARLEASVAAHDLHVSPIRYLKYHEAPAFTDEIDPLLHKRHGLAAEQELRLLRVDEAHYRALVPKDASVSELSEPIYVDWVLSDVIDEIIISPYADLNYEDLVLDAINAKDPNWPVAWCCRNYMSAGTRPASDPAVSRKALCAKLQDDGCQTLPLGRYRAAIAAATFSP
jgi:hypothetical protein